MCGIVAVASFSPTDWTDVAGAMSDVLAHRGPDDSGLAALPSEGVALAQRRLSIVDLAGGHRGSNQQGLGLGRRDHRCLSARLPSRAHPGKGQPGEYGGIAGSPGPVPLSRPDGLPCHSQPFAQLSHMTRKTC